MRHQLARSIVCGGSRCRRPLVANQRRSRGSGRRDWLSRGVTVAVARATLGESTVGVVPIECADSTVLFVWSLWRNWRNNRPERGIQGGASLPTSGKLGSPAPRRDRRTLYPQSSDGITRSPSHTHTHTLTLMNFLNYVAGKAGNNDPRAPSSE